MTLTGNFHEIDDVITTVPGWTGLLVGLRQRLNDLDVDVHVDQVKEKFGGLRFYYSTDDDVSQTIVRIIDNWVEGAETASFLLCYLCGAGVTHQGSGYWVRYFCANHDTADVHAQRAQLTRSASAQTQPAEVAQSPETER